MIIQNRVESKTILKGGKILGRVLAKLLKMCRPGISTGELDRAAEKMILKAGGRPAFKNYRSSAGETPFPTTICASLNHELVHGVAKTETILKDGDILTIDIGMEYPYKKTKKGERRGFYTDTAATIAIGRAGKETAALLATAREALAVGIKAAKPGASVADIGQAIETFVKSRGSYGVIRDLCGHGVGRAVHEEPSVPNYFDRRLVNYILRPGQVIALEPMISLGDYRVATAPDGWTVEMADKSLCAHFEHTIVITKNGCRVATKRPGEKI